MISLTLGALQRASQCPMIHKCNHRSSFPVLPSCCKRFNALGLARHEASSERRLELAGQCQYALSIKQYKRINYLFVFSAGSNPLFAFVAPACGAPV